MCTVSVAIFLIGHKVVFRTQVQLQSEGGLCVCLSLSPSWGGLGCFPPVLCFSSLPHATSGVSSSAATVIPAPKIPPLRSGVFLLPSSTEADTGNVLTLLEREKNCWWHWKQKQKSNWRRFNVSDHLGDRARTKGFYALKETEMPF